MYTVFEDTILLLRRWHIAMLLFYPSPDLLIDS